MKPKLRIGVVYDFRNPADSGVDNKTFYSELMEQAVWLENLGLDLIWFTEHHFVDDGYLPSWIPVAAAMAAMVSPVPPSRPARPSNRAGAGTDRDCSGQAHTRPLGRNAGLSAHRYRDRAVTLPRAKAAAPPGVAGGAR